MGVRTPSDRPLELHRLCYTEFQWSKWVGRGEGEGPKKISIDLCFGPYKKCFRQKKLGRGPFAPPPLQTTDWGFPEVDLPEIKFPAPRDLCVRRPTATNGDGVCRIYIVSGVYRLYAYLTSFSPSPPPLTSCCRIDENDPILVPFWSQNGAEMPYIASKSPKRPENGQKG